MGGDRRDWLVRFALVGANVSVGAGIQAVSALQFGRPWQWEWFWFAVGLLWLQTALTPFFRRLIRTFDLPSHPQQVPTPAERRRAETAEVLRTRTLPDGADVDAWRVRLRRDLRMRLAGGVGVIAFTLIVAGLTAFAAEGDGLVLALAVLLLLMAVPWGPLLVHAHRSGSRRIHEITGSMATR